MRLSASACARIALVILLAGAAAGAIAQESGNSKALASTDEWVQEVGRLFAQADTSVAKKGYKPGSWLYTGSLNNGATERVKIDLSGQQSVILGMCDRDCSDLNLQLLDADGIIVDTDNESDDVPLIETSGSGDYVLIVSMAKCDADPCRYGLKQYVK